MWTPLREKNESIKQYTWLKTAETRISTARLDRFLYFFLFGTVKHRSYWYFNIKLLQDEFSVIWEEWRQAHSGK